MQISLKSADLVELNDGSASALVVFPGATKVEPAEGQPVFGHPIDGVKVVTDPGEYEFGEISLVALETKNQHLGKAELFEVGMEAVSTLLITENPGEILKDHWDVMGEIDVLVLSMKTEIEDIAKLIKKIVPYIVVIISGDKEAAEKATGLTVESVEKKLKFAKKDFTAEDPVTRLVLLEK